MSRVAGASSMLLGSFVSLNELCKEKRDRTLGLSFRIIAPSDLPVPITSTRPIVRVSPLTQAIEPGQRRWYAEILRSTHVPEIRCPYREAVRDIEKVASAGIARSQPDPVRKLAVVDCVSRKAIERVLISLEQGHNFRMTSRSTSSQMILRNGHFARSTSARSVIPEQPSSQIPRSLQQPRPMGNSWSAFSVVDESTISLYSKLIASDLIPASDIPGQEIRKRKNSLVRCRSGRRVESVIPSDDNVSVVKRVKSGVGRSGRIISGDEVGRYATSSETGTRWIVLWIPTCWISSSFKL